MPANPTLDKGLEWLSRTLAILAVMVGPGLLGSFLDHRLGVQFLTPTGLVVGTILATFFLLLLTRQFVPKARGKPIPFDDEPDDSGDDGRDT